MNRSGLILAVVLAVPLTARGEEVRFEQGKDRVVVRVGGQTLGTYIFDDAKTPRPYFMHLHAPGGVQVTRNHPPRKGDASDHAELHPGLWLAFSDLGGNDYWRLKAKVAHDGFADKPQGGKDRGGFAVRNRYLSADGKTTVCRETCRLTFHVRPTGWLVIWDSTLTAEQDLTLGEGEEMGLGLRVATPLTVTSGKGGRILDSEGRRDGKGVWGKRGLWCDYSGPLDGRWVGVQVMPDPANARPCWWHARDYGLLGANPTGSRSAEPAKLPLKKGESLRLRFGVLLHATEKEGDLDLPAAHKDFLGLVKDRP